MISSKKLFISILVLIIVVSVLGFLIWYFYTDTDRQLKKIAIDYYSGNLDVAIEKLEKIISKNHNSADAYILLATTYSEKGSVSFNEKEYALKAIEAIKKSLELKSDNSEAYRVLGYSYEIMENYEEAQANYLKAIELNSISSLAYSNLGHSYDLQGNLSKAEELYLKALSFDQYNFHALNNLARIYIRNNKPDDAEKVLKTSLEKNPDNRMNAEAYQMLAIIEKSFRNNPEKSREYLQTALSYDQGVPQIWVELGMNKMSDLPYLESKDDWDKGLLEVEDYIQKALAINKNQTSAYLLSALLSSYKGEYIKAEEMRIKGLEVVDLDITLGQQEKDQFKSMLGSISALWVNNL